MGADAKSGQTYLNYVVPRRYGDSNGFQAGSTFKAFVLSAAISQGIPLSTSINSPQQVYLPNNRFKTCDGYLRSSDVWQPQNSTGSGTFNLYTGAQRSVNTFFAQLEQRTGLCQPVRLAREMGVTVPDKDVVPPFTLGVTDTDPLTMASAYATFAARGIHCEPRPVTAVLNSRGKVVEDYPKKCGRVLRTEVADAVNDILRGVQEAGGFGNAAGLALNQQSAGKTGTTNSNMAVWFVGYTPNLAAASMIAGANSKGQHITLNGQIVGGSYISGAAGSTTAGPVWGDAMKAVEQYIPDDGFIRPDPQTIRGHAHPGPVALRPEHLLGLRGAAPGRLQPGRWVRGGQRERRGHRGLPQPELGRLGSVGQHRDDLRLRRDAVRRAEAQAQAQARGKPKPAAQAGEGGGGERRR